MRTVNKIAQLTLGYWAMKICATTLGETAGDLLSMTMNVGYAQSTISLLAIFAVSLVFQMRAKKFIPFLFWTVMLTTSIAGTTLSDFLDRTLELGYALGASLLLGSLCMVLLLWHRLEKSLSVSSINTRRAELFYWSAILLSNTLGTALGDFLADDSGLGFVGGAILMGSLMALVGALYRYTKVNTVVLFWIAFVLTRPFGATFGDWLSKPLESGGLNLGTLGSSAVLACTLLVLVFWSTRLLKAPDAQSSSL